MKPRLIALSILLVVLVAFSGCTQSAPNNGLSDSQQDSGPNQAELNAAISEIKGIGNPNRIIYDKWQAFANPVGDGIVVVNGAGSFDSSWLVQGEKICAINGSAKTASMAVFNIQYCKDKEGKATIGYSDIKSLIR